MSSSPNVFVADRDTLKEVVRSTVRQVMVENVPEALREASLPKWLSRKQAKKRYGLTNRQLQYLRDEERITYSQHGRRIWYLRESMDEYFDEGRVEAAHVA